LAAFEQSSILFKEHISPIILNDDQKQAKDSLNSLYFFKYFADIRNGYVMIYADFDFYCWIFSMGIRIGVEAW
jgi:hypothetical protein